MVKMRILRGSKQQIAETIARISGEVYEAVVFVGEPSDQACAPSGEDIFAEMEPHMVKVGGADYSREVIYTRMEGRDL
jgi:hypothetical protein